MKEASGRVLNHWTSYDKKAAVLAVAKHTVFKQDKMNGAQVRIPTLQMITPSSLQHFLGAVQCLHWSEMLSAVCISI